MKKMSGVAVVALLMIHLMPTWASASTITLYNSMPDPLPGNLPSQGYECCRVKELGQGVNLAGSGAFNNVTLEFLMSNWALESTYESVGLSSGFNVNMTANLYEVTAGNSVGALIGSVSGATFIPWRPESDPSCTGSSNPSGGWKDGSGNCWSGSLSKASFDFGSLFLPSKVIASLAYNTYSGGYNPTGAHSGADSLNVALNTASPLVGSPITAGTVYGAFGAGSFGADSGWAPYEPALSLRAEIADAAPVPEPATLVLLGTGMLATVARRRKKAKALEQL